MSAVHYIRMYQSAVDPADVEAIQQLFDDDVRPAFEGTLGCSAIELLINTQENAGGLVDGCALTRWDSLDRLEAALDSRPVREALVRVRELLRQEPVTRTYRVLD